MVSLKKLKEGLNETSCKSIYVNPLTDTKHHHSYSDGDIKTALTNKTENSSTFGSDKENQAPANSNILFPTRKAMKPNSLQTCMQRGEQEKASKSKIWDGLDEDSVNIWDYSSELEAAPASSWATLPNRALLCRPLPVDVGRCTCVIVKEESIKGFHGGGTLYSLYTNEGKGRQDRKLAVAHHRRHNGKSQFRVAQNLKGILSSSDDSFLGNVTANFFGSKYHIMNKGQHVNGLPKDCQGKLDKVYKLYSKIPHYNHNLKQYELDFRDRGRAGLRIQSSVKNFQMTLEENGKQTILQLGRVSKSKFVMDFRYPLSGFQAFCMSLASIDSKVCCAI